MRSDCATRGLAPVWLLPAMAPRQRPSHQMGGPIGSLMVPSKPSQSISDPLPEAVSETRGGHQYVAEGAFGSHPAGRHYCEREAARGSLIGSPTPRWPGTSPREVRESHPGRPARVVVHGLLCGPQRGGGSRRISGAEIAGVHGVGPTGDQDPQAMTGSEGVTDGPQGHRRRERPVRISADGRRVKALQTVAHVVGPAVG